MARQVVTVFGASGFIGRHVVQRLAAAGHIVRAAVRDPEAALYLKTQGEVGQVVPTYANVADAASVAAAVQGASAVVNLVGILYESGAATFDAIHVSGAANVAKAAREAGAKALVHMSALGADGASESAYARTKAEGETAVRTAFPDAVIVRPSVVFGPEDNFFNLFAGLSRFTPVMPVMGAAPKLVSCCGVPWLDMLGDGGPKFQPVYVGDVADAIVKGLTDHTARGQTYELGGPTVYSFQDLMTLIQTVTGRKRLLAPVPFVAAEALGLMLQWLPKPLLTRDQVLLMQAGDNVLAGESGLAQLGIDATPAETVLPRYLNRFRPTTAQKIRPA